jgi:RNA polymerase sigma-70 factor (ECF subfamily)
MSEYNDNVVSLFLKNKPRLISWVKRFLKSSADVEDIVQEAYVKSYQHLIDKEIENPSGYMFTTAKNLALKHNELAVNRLSDRLADLNLDDLIRLEDPVERAALAREEMSCLCEAIRELPLQCRKVFVLKKVYGFSHKEIANRMNLSENTVHRHLAKGVARCTVYMSNLGYSRSNNNGKVDAALSRNHSK